MSKRVYQFRLDGKFVKEFDSEVEAADEIGVKPFHIREVCKFKKPSIFGNVFLYLDDIEFSGLEIDHHDMLIIDGYIKLRDKNKMLEIRQYTKDNKLLKVYKNLTEAAKETGLNKSGISRACSGSLLTCGHYKWSCKGKKKRKTVTSKIIQYSLDDKIIKEWTSANQIESELGYCRSGICKCLNSRANTAYGFKWKRVQSRDNC